MTTVHRTSAGGRVLSVSLQRGPVGGRRRGRRQPLLAAATSATATSATATAAAAAAAATTIGTAAGTLHTERSIGDPGTDTDSSEDMDAETETESEGERGERRERENRRKERGEREVDKARWSRRRLLQHIAKLEREAAL